MGKLLIIDGNAIMHRAYHALPPLTDKIGQPVNAVYGFYSMLIKVLEDQKPQYLIVCFDRPKPTFRKALYSGYQAHRPKMVDGLSSQFVIMHEALERSHITIDEVDGYEADDLIGTLAVQTQDKKLKEKNLEVVILTGDRDLLQLVNAHVKVLAPVKGISEMTIFDEAKVEERFGIKPKQIVDYKALIGDASDGYPGISGIGPKTATNLLSEFGDFENIYANIAKINPKIALKLAKDAEQGALAKKLATIVTDAPVHLNPEQCDIKHTTKEDILEVFDWLHFVGIKKRLEAMTVLTNRPKEKEQLALL